MLAHQCAQALELHAAGPSGYKSAQGSSRTLCTHSHDLHVHKSDLEPMRHWECVVQLDQAEAAVPLALTMGEAALPVEGAPAIAAGALTARKLPQVNIAYYISKS